MVTAATITDDQIRELRASKRSRKLWDLCDRALRNSQGYDRVARSLCAQLVNDRAKKSTKEPT